MQNTPHIVVLGGTGLIGSKVVALLRGRGAYVVAASPSSGVDAATGAGLAAALAGADVVVHLTNMLSADGHAMLDFFRTSTLNVLAAGRAAGVRHHVALSVVGTEGLTASPYFLAKLAQEQALREGDVPYTIVRATQFFDFIPGIAQAAADGATVRLAPVCIQPLAPDEVALAVADAALAPPANAIVELAGPDRLRLTELVRRYFATVGDQRAVVADAHATYFGAPLTEKSLVPQGPARTGTATLDGWLAAQRPH
jgi:uncharacterized protein YbjT (DUF2867 family)